jgi:hypothetical protein
MRLTLVVSMTGTLFGHIYEKKLLVRPKPSGKVFCKKLVVYFSVVRQTKSDVGRLVVEVSGSHTRFDSSERVMSSSQWLLLTPHTTNTRDIHDMSGIRTHDLSS